MFSQIKGYFFPRTHNSVIDPNNGSTFQNIYIPDEVLELILSHVETRSLLACRRVCKKWQTLIDTQVLKMKAQEAGYTHGMDIETKNSMSWSMWYAMLSPFTSNLVKNPCGHNKLVDWDIIASGGDGWIREESPTGFSGDNYHLPFENKMKNYWQMKEKPEFWKSKEKSKEYCFVTSFGVCAKQQIISLARTKSMMHILDKFKPIIVYRDWYCRRGDCGGIYKLKMCLLDENKEPLAVQMHVTTINDLNWQKVENKFENYPPGVRYVLFHHQGVDNQFWRGHYGPKMTESTVFMLPPGIPYDITMENNLPISTAESQEADLRMNFRNPIEIIEDRGEWEDDEESIGEESNDEESINEEIDNEYVGRVHLIEREEGRREENDWDGIPEDLIPPPYEGRRGEGEREREE